MAIIKCKMCGGDLDIVEGKTVAECEYCGSIQTIPAVDDEKKVNLFNRANRLRAQSDYDRAAGVYESIVADFPNEAEAYWGLVLCKYGITYVTDPATGNKIPTCNRSSFDNVLEDPNCQKALECADVAARKVYNEEARYIESIRKGIIEVSNKEAPYDVFICYKETAEDGNRTMDSVIAQDIYDKLTEKGYRVFFSRITLESMLGAQYEPYIFAALNSAKVMLVFGTKVEYFNAVWVKNEWSRYLRIMAKDKSKHLIPCYRGIDPYDMPEEFASFQAQDMGKVGADQDLLRGIAKFLPKGEPKAQQTTVIASGPNVQSLMKRGNDALESGSWDEAHGFYDQLLNMDAGYAPANLGMALAELRARDLGDLVYKLTVGLGKPKVQTYQGGKANKELETNLVRKYQLSHYLEADEIKEKIQGFDFSYNSEKSGWEELQRRAQDTLKNKKLALALKDGDSSLKERINSSKDEINNYYVQRIDAAKAKDDAAVKELAVAYQTFMTEGEAKIADLRKDAEDQREFDYQEAITDFGAATSYDDYQQAKDAFEDPKIAGYKESADYAQQCEVKLEEIRIRDAKTHDGRIVRRTWISAAIALVIMTAYTFLASSFGVRDWVIAHVLPFFDLQQSQAFLGIFGVLGLIIGAILTHKIMRNWSPFGCITMLIKGYLWLIMCTIFAAIIMVIGGLIGPVLVILSGEYLPALVGFISLIRQLVKGRGFYRKGNRFKVFLSILITIAAAAALVYVGRGLLEGDTIKLAFQYFIAQ